MSRKQSVNVTFVAKFVEKAIVFIFLITLILVARPLWHGLLFGVIWRHLGFWVATVIAVVVSLFWVIGGEHEESHFGRLILVFLCWLLFLFWSQNTYGVTVSHSFEPELVREIPETIQVRFVPFEVAQTLAEDFQREPTKAVGDIDPLITDEGLVWVAPCVPNGWWNKLTSGIDKLVIVDETMEVQFVDQPFKYGEEAYLWNGLAWQLFSKRFAAEYPEIFYVPVNDGWIGVAPYVTYQFVFPVFVPQWGGVMIINPNGAIEDLTPAQAQLDARLVGQRLFPEALAKAYAGSWGYRFGGLPNIWFTHREQVEIANLANTENQMPYFVPSSWGTQWTVAVNPSGPSDSTYKVFWFDARTGYARLNEFSKNENLLGPNAGEVYARGKTPGYVWRVKEEGTYALIEPRPVINNGALFWMYSLTAMDMDGDWSGVHVTVLLDAANKDRVLHFCSRRTLMNWLEGKGSSDSLPCGTVAPQSTPSQPQEPVSGDCEELWRQLETATQNRDQQTAARVLLEIVAKGCSR